MADQLPAIELMKQYRKSDHILQQLREGGFATCNQLVMYTRKEVSERTGLSRAQVHNLRKTARKIILAETGVDTLADAVDEEEIQDDGLMKQYVHISNLKKHKVKCIRQLEAAILRAPYSRKHQFIGMARKVSRYVSRLNLRLKDVDARIRASPTLMVRSLNQARTAVELIGEEHIGKLRCHPLAQDDVITYLESYNY